jgi:hypothetical protein
MVDLLLKLAVILLSLNVLIVATGWYATNTLKYYFPGWWQRTIVDKDPE